MGGSDLSNQPLRDEGMRSCPRCGGELLRYGNYCNSCGYRVEGLARNNAVASSAILANQASIRKWKAMALVLSLINVILIGMLYGQYTIPLSIEYGKLKGQYSELESSYSSLDQGIQSVETWYESLKYEIDLRQGMGDKCQLFITPDDPSVKNLVEDVTGGWHNTSNWEEYWSDVKGMYDWIVSNICYSYDSPTPCMPEILGGLTWRDEFYRFPNETIDGRCGDCEDQASLLASMILDYGNREYTVWVIRFDSDTSAHLAVALPVEGGKLSILDTTGGFYTRSWDGRLTSEKIYNAVDEWIRYWRDQGDRNVRITQVHSEDVYEEFNTTEEFIAWAYNQ